MSGDRTISQNGTKTKARATTHSPRLVTDGRCPKCFSRHVLGTVSSNGQLAGAYWCGSCGAIFNAMAAA